MSKLSQREQALVNLLVKAKQAYYFSGNPIISDTEYDALEDELKRINPEHAVLKSVGAPIPTSAKHLTKVKHRMMMGSQSKVNSSEEFAAWCSRRQNSEELHCSLKADGCSIAAYYKDGKLLQVVSRGDGETGEDVTANALCFKNLPFTLPATADCSVRLEAVLTMKDWAKLDPSKASNPRSLANGILGRKDGKNTHLITALAFDVEGVNLSSEEEKSNWLEKQGFTTTAWAPAKSPDKVIEFFNTAQEHRDKETWAYWSDGIVIKLNSIEKQRKLGISSGRPKGQIAWKFTAEQATSTILEVEWSVGHSGAISPIASISPVRLGGTTVQRVSLANSDMIAALGARIGSKVEVVKAGDIIPKIVRVIKPGNGPIIKSPVICPSCHSKLEKFKNVDGSHSTVTYCRNSDCDAQESSRISRWADSRNILGLGEAVIQALCDSGTVATVADLFKLKADKIKDLIINQQKQIRLGIKRATNLCSEIQEKGTIMSLPEFLGSFGTHKLGVRRAELMLQANPALYDFEKWFDGSLENEAFASTAGVPNMGVQILAGLKEREKEIRATLRHIQLSKPEKDTKPKTTLPAICITGSLPSGKKKHEWEEPLRLAGFQLVDTVTKDLHALVVSNPATVSSKQKKAVKLGIPVISELELANLTLKKSAS